MESSLSPDRRRAEDTAWVVSAGARQGAREADACMAADDWLYAAPAPPLPAEPRASPSTPPPQPPTR